MQSITLQRTSYYVPNLTISLFDTENMLIISILEHEKSLNTIQVTINILILC